MAAPSFRTLPELLSAPRIVVLGYGQEGKSVHRFLLESCPHGAIAIADKKPVELIREAPPETALFTGDHYLAGLHKDDLVIRSPGISPLIPELRDFMRAGGRTTTLTNLFMCSAPGKVIGITGTKGKSTTASLTAAILSRRFPDVRLLGNIGKPSLDELPGSGKDTLFVHEFSSFQLEDISKSPHVAILLGIAAEHLDHHGSFEAYVSAKGNITKHQGPEDFLITNPQAPSIAGILSESRASKHFFSASENEKARVFLRGGCFVARDDDGRLSEVLPESELPLLGPGNRQNALAAITAGFLFGVPIEKIREAVTAFRPLEHRLEWAGEYSGISFYNDSLSTIPEAAVNALEALGTKVQTLILGGYDRGLSYEVLGRYLAERERLGPKLSLILFPDTGEKIWAAYERACGGRTKSEKFPVASMEEAVRLAYTHTDPGRVCLLSPASSSFNMFKDYRERGEIFKRLVRELGARDTSDM